MAQPDFRQFITKIRSHCPECNGRLSVLRVIGGSRSGAEYWAMQCAGCKGIHLDIVEPPTWH